ncbi:DUF6922 domain-containing protein [Carboxydothermus ferrireducens]|uniref:DUF6922 domain-containing protein n=1 Tax=Carboxydothermus ferrireducens DSM 11255 TaxID=1119529 RepID=A0ABX2REQ9_9THEO|nr:hypothetical protein [Carboxydothermus ferrireducens]NYE58571.1 hypothetical protein [Carboxydothermus ferrireducens DSM 11255]
MEKTLPEEFKVYFWDVELCDLNIEKHKRFIIERILNFGDHRALKWVLSNYDEATIKEVVQNSRNLTPKTARFWQYYFKLSEEEMRCFIKH